MAVTTCMKYADATITQYYNSDKILVDLKILKYSMDRIDWIFVAFNEGTMLL